MYIGTTKYMITPQPIRPCFFIHLDASDWNTHADGDLHTE